MRSLRHLRYLFWHKIYVFKAGLRWRVPIWQLIIHDWSKFLPSEFIPYTRHFFTPGMGKKDSPTFKAFQWAFTLHWRRNPHHWEYWNFYYINPKMNPVPMPERYAREMLADWEGTGWSKNGRNDTVEFYLSNRDRIKLHPKTREWVEYHLGISGR